MFKWLKDLCARGDISPSAGALLPQVINMRYGIKLSKSEIQSQHDRVKWAEGLILQLPETHEGRNSWLLNYGKSAESLMLRENYFKEYSKPSDNLSSVWDNETESMRYLWTLP